MCRKILFSGTLAESMQVNILHSYPITSIVINDAVTVNPINMTNHGMVYTYGGVYGDGYSNYAYANLGLNTDNWFGVSVWAKRMYTFTAYQFLFGGLNYRTYEDMDYNWFIGLFNNKISQISTPLVGTAEQINVPFHIAASVNIVRRLISVFRNGVQIYSGSLTMGGYTGGSNLDTFSIGGFTGFSGTYAKSSLILSAEVTAGPLTVGQARALYQKGAL